MKNSKKGLTSSEAFEKEDARVGYETAITLGMALNQLIWSIFNTMVVAHSIVIAGLGLVLTSDPLNSPLRVLLSIIGLIMCLVWFYVAKRQQDYLSYYMMSAREIEEKYFNPTITTVSRGGTFSDGKSVSLQLGGKQKVLRMSFWSRLMKGGAASNTIIVVFATVYIGVLFI